ncbi:S8 family serine peptidase [Streptomyces sp. TP-A0874]|uniref:S8 family serine peptidase n=1 Tax=Streptomyces sp. TP-A0874 TaxID=549819 RepID=UPI0009A06C75|nr:S8 family serine peptidase [Streptomyces sp. TP-A0874]
MGLTAAVFVSVGGFAPAAAALDQDQWYLDAMKADLMWEVSTGEKIKVAVIDTGVDDSLPELKGRVLPGADLSHSPRDINDDDNGHGTQMASLIAGTGAGGGIQGVAPDAKILPIRPWNSKEDYAPKSMARAIRYAIDNGSKIINISMRFDQGPGKYPELQSAVDHALKNDVLVFAGTGNEGESGNAHSGIAATPGVVGIGAVDRNGRSAAWSTYGPEVALVAAGDEMPGRCPERRKFCMTSGTSNATAIASGSAALIWSKHPDWTSNQVLRVMMETAGKPKGKIPSKYLGYGSIRPAQVLLEGKGDPGPPDVNPLLAARESAKPTPATSAPEGKNADEPPNQPADREDGEAETAGEAGRPAILWTAVGAVAAVAIAAAVLVMRVRRKSP